MQKLSRLIALCAAWKIATAYAPMVRVDSNSNFPASRSQIVCRSGIPSPEIVSSRPFSQNVILHAIIDKPHSQQSSSSPSDSNSEKENEQKVTGKNLSFDWGKSEIPVLPRRKETSDISISNQSSSSTERKETMGSNKKKPIIYHVETLEEYKEVVADETSDIVVVRFYAEWCKACKAIQASYSRLAHLYNNEEDYHNHYPPKVKFVEVPLTKKNIFLHQGLGVSSLPFGHIYYPKVGLVEERKIAKKNFSDFANVLESYVRGSCDCEFLVNDAGKVEVMSSS